MGHGDEDVFLRRAAGPEEVEDLLRACAPEVLAAFVGRFGDFDLCEGVFQEVLVAAAREWPERGIPSYERSRLLTTAVGALIGRVRRAEADRRGEAGAPALTDRAILAYAGRGAPGEDVWEGPLSLFLLCCHPDLPRAARTALVLRVVGGLGPARVAAFFDLPEETLERYVARARRTIVEGGWARALPVGEERAARLAEVRSVLRLVHDRGHAAEAARLARLLDRSLPGGGGAQGVEACAPAHRCT
ncbi:sigma factor-like helix-turn-helix DNA-binding protein [Streptomyces sp. NPDC088752]|uniref:sigma factor-like helix-turn-helix DNA-binding protein n=1 Tax=Streptomyces sp. NPDC088752 TaxID=3154963 RepID=UPI003428C665